VTKEADHAALKGGEPGVGILGGLRQRPAIEERFKNCEDIAFAALDLALVGARRPLVCGGLPNEARERSENAVPASVAEMGTAFGEGGLLPGPDQGGEVLGRDVERLADGAVTNAG